MKLIKGYLFPCLFVLFALFAGCVKPGTTAQPLARIQTQSGAVEIPLAPYSAYLRVIGELTAADAKEELMALTAIYHDLEGTDYAPDMAFFEAQAAGHLDESVLSDDEYKKRLDLVAGAVGLAPEELYKTLSFDLLSQYLSSLMFDKLWSELPEPQGDGEATDEQLEDMRYEACLEAFYDYLDEVPARVSSTGDPAVYLVDGSELTLPDGAAAYLDYCRYLTHIERTYEIMSLTAFVKEMERHGAVFDDEKILEEAALRVDELYSHDPEMARWIGDACESVGVTIDDFDKSYTEVQAMDIRFSYCDGAFANYYASRPDSQKELSEGELYALLMESLLNGGEIISVTAFLDEEPG